MIKSTPLDGADGHSARAHPAPASSDRFGSVLSSLSERVTDLATNTRHVGSMIPLLVALDAVLCAFVVSRVPYTEIDWKTYMEQVRLVFEKGERDYSLISGPTGPLVYPSIHVAIYGLLFRITSGGTDIRLAQWIFAGLYLVGLTLALKVYAKAGAPPYVLPLLLLSRRLHSIFMLRMFNDCFVAIFTLGAVLSYQHRRYLIGSCLLALGISTKMSALLVLPALACVLLVSLGLSRTITQLLVMAYLQALFAYPFLRVSGTSYFLRAFDLSRQFEYKWTVNWKVIPEDAFLSKTVAFVLLILHLVSLVWFGFTRWIVEPYNAALSYADESVIRDEKLPPTRRVGPLTALRLSLFDRTAASEGVMGRLQSIVANVAKSRSHIYVPSALFASNAIGLLFARSLHYQFYAWLFWTTPFILWRSVARLSSSPSALWPVKMAFIAVVVGIQEWAWNVYPSSWMSSATVLATLAAQVGASWIGEGADFERLTHSRSPAKKDD